jgi:hypothetical protein
MTKTLIPGVKAAHQIITPECRANKTDVGALEEALENVGETYRKYVGSSGRGTKWHVILVRDDSLEPG